MKKIIENISSFIIAAFALLFSLLLTPFIVLAELFGKSSDTNAFTEEYNNYLTSIEGTKFICYTTRKNTQAFFEERVKPYLPAGVHVILLEGKKPKSAFTAKYISYMLYHIRDKKGFPNMMKVQDGIVTDVSLKTEFYKAMQDGNTALLTKRINDFYADAGAYLSV